MQINKINGFMMATVNNTSERYIKCELPTSGCWKSAEWVASKPSSAKETLAKISELMTQLTQETPPVKPAVRDKQIETLALGAKAIVKGYDDKVSHLNVFWSWVAWLFGASHKIDAYRESIQDQVDQFYLNELQKPELDLATVSNLVARYRRINPSLKGPVEKLIAAKEVTLKICQAIQEDNESECLRLLMDHKWEYSSSKEKLHQTLESAKAILKTAIYKGSNAIFKHVMAKFELDFISLGPWGYSLFQYGLHQALVAKNQEAIDRLMELNLCICPFTDKSRFFKLPTLCLLIKERPEYFESFLRKTSFRYLYETDQLFEAIVDYGNVDLIKLWSTKTTTDNVIKTACVAAQKGRIDLLVPLVEFLATSDCPAGFTPLDRSCNRYVESIKKLFQACLQLHEDTIEKGNLEALNQLLKPSFQKALRHVNRHIYESSNGNKNQPLPNLLKSAAGFGRIEMVKTLMATKDYSIEDYKIAFKKAAAAGQTKILSLFLADESFRAEIKKGSRILQGAFRTGARYHQKEVMSLLMAEELFTCGEEAWGKAMTSAIKEDKIEIFKLLISPRFHNFVKKYQVSCLNCAVYWNRQAMFDLLTGLTNRLAVVSPVVTTRSNPLLTAAERGRPELLKKMLERLNTYPDYIEVQWDKNVDSKKHPLVEATRQGHRQIVEMLLEYRKKHPLSHTRDLQEAYDVAFKAKNIELTQLLAHELCP